MPKSKVNNKWLKKLPFVKVEGGLADVDKENEEYIITMSTYYFL